MPPWLNDTNQIVTTQFFIHISIEVVMKKGKNGVRVKERYMNELRSRMNETNSKN